MVSPPDTLILCYPVSCIIYPRFPPNTPERWALCYGVGLVHSLHLCCLYRGFNGRARVVHAVGLFDLRSCERILMPVPPERTSAGLYYFSAKMASEKRSALASWITGWSNITGQVTLICSINYSWYVSFAPALGALFILWLVPNLSRPVLR